MRIEFLDENTIRIQAPAKINLFLEILGKREDGFHEIETVMAPIQLFDILTVKRVDQSAIKLEVETPDESAASRSAGDAAWSIPADDNNLVVRSAKAVKEATGCPLGFEIRLQKTVPAAAGLGGGSSDSAATVVACMLLARSWNRATANEICASLGSDIPFFLGSESGIGLMLSKGRGEICTPLDVRPSFSLLLSHPSEGCSTAQIYQQFQLLQTVRGSEKIISACEAGQVPKIGAELFNALQSAASDLNPWIGKQLDLFSSFGLSLSLMSGSGSSCFALAWPDEVNFAEIREQALRSGIPRIYHTSPWYAPSIEQQVKSVPQNNI